MINYKKLMGKNLTRLPAVHHAKTSFLKHIISYIKDRYSVNEMMSYLGFASKQSKAAIGGGELGYR